MTPFEMSPDEAHAEAVRCIRKAVADGSYELRLVGFSFDRLPQEFEQLRGSTITSFSLFLCPALSDLSPVAGQADLASLALIMCPALSDLSPLAGLAALTSLCLDGCRANEFSPLRGLLDRLEVLSVFDTRFSDLHPIVCGRVPGENTIDAVRAYYAALGPDAKPDAEVKVFVLGNGHAGKTKLVGRLQGDAFDAVPEGSTHGVRVVSVDAPDDWGLPHPVRLNVWDFGGQDIYHGTHALFLRAPAIYVVLYSHDTTDETPYDDDGVTVRNRPLEYWFDYLRQEAGTDGVVSSPVLFVQAKCDEDGPAPTYRPAREQFPQLTRLIPVSAKEADGLDHFGIELKKAVQRLLRDHPQPPLPASWDDVRKAVREMQKAGEPRTMALADLAALCATHGCPGDEAVLRDALHLMGVVFYRPGVFGDRLVVDPSWALEAIYAVSTRDRAFQEKLRGQHGKFDRGDLRRVWADYPDAADQRTFLGFMEQCGVCFRTRARDRYAADYDGKYTAPALLEAWGPDQEQDYGHLPGKPGRAEVTVTYLALHDGVTRGLLAKVGAVAGDRASYWRDGCHFFDGAAGSEVLVRTDGNAIRLQAWGGDACGVLATVVEVLLRMPSGTPPAVAWSDGVAGPADARRDERAGPPDERLDPTYGPKSVFFSYRHPHPDHPGSDRGRRLLVELRDLLAADGWAVRFDGDVIQNGDSISEFIAEVRACAFFVPVFCGRYFESQYTLSELFTFREKFAHDGLAFADRTVTLAYPESEILDDKVQAKYVTRCRTRFDEYKPLAGDLSLAPHTYARVYYLYSWSLRLSELLADLNDRLNTPSAAGVAARLNRTYRRLNPA